MLTDIHPKLPMRNKAITEDYYLNKLGFENFGSADELYWDRPKELWTYKPDGSIEMFTKPLDMGNLLEELIENKSQ